MVAALHLFRQGEEGLRFLLGSGDEVGGDAVVGDDGEAVALERIAELLGEAFGVCVGRLQRDGGDSAGGGGESLIV
jgi:hypothetical protein